MFLYRKYLIVLKYCLLISIFINIYTSYNSNILFMILLFSLSTLLMVNDYIRYSKLAVNSRYAYSITLFLSVCGAMGLAYFVDGIGASVYLFFPLVEILTLKGIKMKILFSIHFLLFLTIAMARIGMPDVLDKLYSLGITFLNYFAVVSIAFSVIIVRREKEEVIKLNEKLQETNVKLHQYILEVEELTASKERTMMAQELHDSVGHSLMALAMHLEFARKICDVKPSKVKEVLVKSEDIAKSSIESLRQAVKLFKEEKEIKDFNEAVEEIINNFYMFNDIKINFDLKENVDNLSSVIKNSMYITIKEFITNSIKHGKATEIDIESSRENKNIKLILTNNGTRCHKIIKSNGLTGIENRINSLKGYVQYFNNEEVGFGINISIPIFMEEI